jgi:hypothetical protein
MYFIVCNGRQLYSQFPTTHHTILTIEGMDPFVCRKNRCLYTLNNYNVDTYIFFKHFKNNIIRPRIISTFGTTRVVDRQPYAPAAFTPGEIHGTHFPTSRHMVLSEGTTEKIPVTPPGIDPGTVRLVVQRLNHYATPDPHYINIKNFNRYL